MQVNKQNMLSNTIKTFALLLIVWLRMVGASSSLSSQYHIPDVKIEVYHPRGLRVMIPNEENLQLFAFHGNINRRMRDYEIGQYYKDVLRPVNGWWIYEDKVVRLRKGDKLYYWLYVLHDRLGYRKDKQVFLIDELIHDPMPELNEDPMPELNETDEIHFATTTRPSIPLHQTQTNDELQGCNQLVVNLTQVFIKTAGELDIERRMNELLSEMVLARSDYKKLTMRGRLSLTEAPKDIVALVLSEKLGLQPNITAAQRNADRSITFELVDLGETLQVIAAAKDKLANSTAVSITY